MVIIMVVTVMMMMMTMTLVVMVMRVCSINYSEGVRSVCAVDFVLAGDVRRRGATMRDGKVPQRRHGRVSGGSAGQVRRSQPYKTDHQS